MSAFLEILAVEHQFRLRDGLRKIISTEALQKLQVGEEGYPADRLVLWNTLLLALR